MIHELADCGVVKDDEERSVINPLYLEAARLGVIFGEGSLNVARLELLGKAGQGQDPRHGRRELCERSGHIKQRLAFSTEKTERIQRTTMGVTDKHTAGRHITLPRGIASLASDCDSDALATRETR